MNPGSIPSIPSFPLISISRMEFEDKLYVLEGSLPADLTGFIFLNSPAGTANSNLHPFPPKLADGSPNPDYASPIFNGDGYVFRFDFSKSGQVMVKTRLLKPPCFYADQATAVKGMARERKNFRGFAFKNFGISRISSRLGARNQLNTAIQAFSFDEDKAPRLMATSDAGRPYEMDPESLELLRPIGALKDWYAGQPPFVKYVFPVAMTSAHPCFDPKSKELFMVNYIQPMSEMISGKQTLKAIRLNPEPLKDRFISLLDGLDGNRDGQVELIEKLNEKLGRLARELKISRWKSFWQNFRQGLDDLWDRLMRRDKHSHDPNVFILRWQGGKSLDRFRLVLPNGQPLIVSQSIHQMSFSKDYLILMDTSFKVALNTLFHNPFPDDQRLARFFRECGTKAMAEETQCYLVQREDLKVSGQDVIAYPLDRPIPMECVHFSADYENPNGAIRLHTAHNNSMCLAEWNRPYDRRFDDPDKTVPADTIGMFNGPLDITGFGKFVIDGPQARIQEEKIVRNPGKTSEIENSEPELGPHSWGTGLYTYAHMISDHQLPNQIPFIYWQMGGVDPDRSTQFISDLYAHYSQREISIEDMRKWTRAGIPEQLQCIDTRTLEVVDYYQFPKGYQERSIQFMPRKGATDPREGYIFCTMLVPDPKKARNYKREIWLFDAQDLAHGPICRMAHPHLNFTYTIHSTWIENACSPRKTEQISVQEEYQQHIRKHFPPWKRKKINQFMKQFVYPHFPENP